MPETWERLTERKQEEIRLQVALAQREAEAERFNLDQLAHEPDDHAYWSLASEIAERLVAADEIAKRLRAKCVMLQAAGAAPARSV